MSINFFKDRYEAQIKRNDHFTSEARITLAGLTIAGGLIGYIFTNTDFLNVDHNSSFKYTFIFGLICFLCSIYFLIKSYFAPRLIDLAASEEWLIHLHKIQKKYLFSGSNNKKSLLEFENDLQEKYASVATHNQKVNDSVGYSIEFSNKALVVCLILVLMSLPISYFGPDIESSSLKYKGDNKMENIINRNTHGGGPGNVPRPGKEQPDDAPKPGRDKPDS